MRCKRTPQYINAGKHEHGNQQEWICRQGRSTRALDNLIIGGSCIVPCSRVQLDGRRHQNHGAKGAHRHGDENLFIGAHHGGNGNTGKDKESSSYRRRVNHSYYLLSRNSSTSLLKGSTTRVEMREDSSSTLCSFHARHLWYVLQSF